MANKKAYAALARVSSREQEREGSASKCRRRPFTVARERMAGKSCGCSASPKQQRNRTNDRQTFKELLNYVRENASELDGLLFTKVDRAARNFADFALLEQLQTDCGIDVIYVTQPTENTPAGRMMRRTLANMATFYTEQQSLDVREGLDRRVKEGLFVGKAPYGYRNVRIEGRSIVEIDPDHGHKIRRIFELFAYNPLTLDSLLERIEEEGIEYTKTRQQFPRSKRYAILRDRAYIGEVKHKGEWSPGSHVSLVDLATFRRVQVILGEKVYHNHELTYGSELIQCGHCGKPISGELKTKKTKSGLKEYVYYRCARYNKPDHPRVRLTEADLDRQVLAMFRSIQIEDAKKREWVERLLQTRTKKDQDQSRNQISDLNRQLTSVRQQQDELVNLRLHKEINADTFSRKSRELPDREDDLDVRVEAAKRGHRECADMAIKVFELLQTLCSKWKTADYAAKRRILEIICLNFTLNGATLVPEMRKPFQILSEGLLVSSSRDDSRCTFVNEIAGLRLVRSLFPESVEFKGDAVLQLVEPGLYSKLR